MENLIALAAVVLIFGPGLLAVWSMHQRKMLELQIQLRNQQEAGTDVRRQLETLRQELSELRHTTTEYDLSVDTQLQHLQQRIAFLEHHLQELEAQQKVRT